MTVVEQLHQLKVTTNAEAAAVINRDGRILAAELPPSVSQDTFSIMCAAILGAGMTAATELGHRAPHRVRLESEDATFVIQEVGERAMLIVVVGPHGTAELESAISRFIAASAPDFR